MVSQKNTQIPGIKQKNTSNAPFFYSLIITSMIYKDSFLCSIEQPYFILTFTLCTFSSFADLRLNDKVLLVTSNPAYFERSRDVIGIFIILLWHFNGGK